ncbi:hypothetical protein Godav_023136 [Gossypium davidsonii]|uniref:DUF4283 domain-containing protein n=1 Tax=Gossypium davidsonii TaxID=34287 RepID=A0A7J8SQP0_GOSDV|nr:hypothetical protein [Gossypium davidsonii]
MEMSLETLSIDEGEDEVWVVAWDEDLGEKIFLLQFFNEIDIARVEKRAPWTFNNHLLISHWLMEEDDPMLVPMIHDNFWVQVHDLPPGNGEFLKNLSPARYAKAVEKEKEIDDFIFKVHLCQFQYLSSKSSSYGEENRNRMGSIIEGTTKECDEHKQYLAKGGMPHFEVRRSNGLNVPVQIGDSNIIGNDKSQLILAATSWAREVAYVSDGERVVRFPVKASQKTTLMLLDKKPQLVRSGILRAFMLVSGDFKKILFDYEKKGGIPRDEGRMKEFRKALFECGLEDIESSSGELIDKLGCIRPYLKVWFERIKTKKRKVTKGLKKKLEELNCQERTDDVMAEIIDVKLHLNMEADQEESYRE